MDPFLGEIRMFAGTFAPVHWQLCHGQLLRVDEYDALFSLLQTRFGGDGATTFGLPDMRGRAPVHNGQGPGLGSYALGRTGGEAMVSLTTNQMGSHGHLVHTTTRAADSKLGKDKVLANAGATHIYGTQGPPHHEFHSKAVSDSGGGEAHGNMAPFLALNFIICVDGIYPSRD